MRHLARTVAALAVAVAALAAPAAAGGATFTVNTELDTVDTGCDPIHCSLREAIEAANAAPGADTIAFTWVDAIFESQRIEPLSPLPPITDPVTIDGTTHDAYLDRPVVELNGIRLQVEGMWPEQHGLVVSGSGVTVRGVSITGFTAGAGVVLRGDANAVEGSYVGISPYGDMRANGDGIRIEDGAGNRVGGTSPAARNLISGNWGQGVVISGPEATENRVEGNLIGTDAAGAARQGNGRGGVLVAHAPGNRIGGTSEDTRNVISGNGGAVWGDGQGVEIVGAAATGNRVEGNYVGTDATGRAALGNASHGILVWGASGNTIGGTEPGARNVISGNGWDCCVPAGVVLAADANRVEGNYIGTDAAGTAALPNDDDGISVQGHDNVIGGTAAGARNVISGNGWSGVVVYGLRTAIQGNMIGTDPTGERAMPNRQQGIWLRYGHDTRIGGSSAGAANVISGNGRAGVEGFNSWGVVVQGNLIGTDRDGTSAIPNLEGVHLDGGSGAVVGGAGAGEGNVISGNRGSGVLIYRAWDGRVQGNRIGTDRSGREDLGNGWDGVIAGGTRLKVGGTGAGEGNTIAHNGASGVYVPEGRSSIQGNEIFDHTYLGIDLAPAGVDQNSYGSRYWFPNEAQDYPVLETAESTASGTRVTGTMRTNLYDATFEIELYASGACDPSGHGEGETFLGRVRVVTPSRGGTARFDVTLPRAVRAGSAVAATATSHRGVTSEFSRCVEVALPPADLSVTQTDASDPVLAGDVATYSLRVANAGAADATGVELRDTLPTGTTLESATPSRGSCSAADGTVTCELGDLAAGDAAGVEVRVRTRAEGTIENRAEVSADQPDPNGSDNVSTESTRVDPAADLSVAIADAPDPAHIGHPVTYTLTVRNDGPSRADAVVLRTALPPRADVQSVVASRGTCSTQREQVTCSLGDLDSGASATVRITVKPKQRGIVATTATVAAATVTDPDGSDNSARQETLVGP